MYKNKKKSKKVSLAKTPLILLGQDQQRLCKERKKQKKVKFCPTTILLFLYCFVKVSGTSTQVSRGYQGYLEWTRTGVLILLDFSCLVALVFQELLRNDNLCQVSFLFGATIIRYNIQMAFFSRRSISVLTPMSSQIELNQTLDCWKHF